MLEETQNKEIPSTPVGWGLDDAGNQKTENIYSTHTKTPSQPPMVVHLLQESPQWLYGSITDDDDVQRVTQSESLSLSASFTSTLNLYSWSQPM